MESSNCFFCAKEVDTEKTIIGGISICLKCLSSANPEDEFRQVRDIISKFKSPTKENK
jgi:hypothetical protein